MSNSLDPEQAWWFVRPSVEPNCLQRLSADVTGKKKNHHCGLKNKASYVKSDSLRLIILPTNTWMSMLRPNKK